MFIPVNAGARWCCDLRGGLNVDDVRIVAIHAVDSKCAVTVVNDMPAVNDSCCRWHPLKAMRDECMRSVSNK